MIISIDQTKARGWFKDKKKATKLPHPNWKICCSKHMNNHKELHAMLHHQQTHYHNCNNLDNFKKKSKVGVVDAIGVALKFGLCTQG